MKRVLSIITIFTLALLLVACRGDRGGQGGGKLVEWYELADDADYDGSKVTVTFWHRMGESNQKLLQKWKAEFEAIYPNITIHEENVAADYDKLADKISLGITAGNYPDIAESYPDHIARYAQGNAPLALNNFINHPKLGYSEEELSDFLSGLWSEGSSYDKDGTILSLPFAKSSEALFFNKTYFDAHKIDNKTYTELITENGTWETVFKIAADIKTRESDAIPFGYDSSDNMFITGSAQWNAPYTGYNEETGKGEVLFNNDASKEMVKYFKDKVDKGLMITRSLNGDAFTSDIMKTGKKLYMYVGSTGGTRYAYEGAGAVFNEGYRVGVVPVPVKDMTNRRQIQQGPNINLFRQKGKEQQMIAAWMFAKFILEPSRTAEYGASSGYAPVRSSAYETDEWKEYLAGIVEEPTTMLQATEKLIKESIEMFGENESIFFTSAVFNLSSKSRSEVGALLNKILAYKGDELDDYINKQYQSSYEFVRD